MAHLGPIVKAVQPGSLAAAMKVEPGWQLLSINHQAVKDILDYKVAIADDHLTIDWRTPSGQEQVTCCQKPMDEDLGIEFTTITLDRPHACQNRCVFCFIDQLPKGMRSTLYFKDDDYRLSFLTGNYISLTNLSQDDLVRIADLRLSPLYVSVQAWDPSVRRQMIGHEKADDLRQQLDYLINRGIELHAQIVLCPGFNDGHVLEETVTKLYDYHSSVLSVAVVPVGLTKHRQGLAAIRPVDRNVAGQVIALTEKLGNQYLDESGTRFVWASDEFYLRAGREVPPDEYYEGYGQLENGVGLVRDFWEGWNEVQSRLPSTLNEPVTATLVTGASGEYALAPIVERLNQIPNCHLTVKPIINEFFGPSVTVTGLVTGQDLIHQLQGTSLAAPVIIPDVMLRDGQDVFLDDVTVDQVRAALAVDVKVVATTASSLLRSLFSITKKSHVVRRRL